MKIDVKHIEGQITDLHSRNYRDAVENNEICYYTIVMVVIY